MRVEGLHVGLEGGRRQRDVVHEQGVPADLLTGPRDRVGQVAGVVGGEAVAREHQVLVHGVEQRVVVQHVAHVVGEPGVVLGLAAVADQHPFLGQQVGRGQRGEGRQHHPPGEVTGRAEQHEDRRLHASTLRAAAARTGATTPLRTGRGARQSTGRYVASSYGVT